MKQKKQRIKSLCFVAEGPKVVQEFIHAGFSLKHLFATDVSIFPEENTILVSEKELQSLSYLTTSNTCLAVFSIPSEKHLPDSKLQVALDGIRDPGNLGTIIRLCDWFGVTSLLCSVDTVDCYNPKVVQASMGSLARVNIQYLDISEYLANADVPIYGAFMDGESIYKNTLPKKGVLVMGNEANGIRSDIEKLVSKRISIPRFGILQETESLNVATATAILLSEFMRNTIEK